MTEGSMGFLVDSISMKRAQVVRQYRLVYRSDMVWMSVVAGRLMQSPYPLGILPILVLDEPLIECLAKVTDNDGVQDVDVDSPSA